MVAGVSVLMYVVVRLYVRNNVHMLCFYFLSLYGG